MKWTTVIAAVICFSPWLGACSKFSDKKADNEPQKNLANGSSGGEAAKTSTGLPAGWGVDPPELPQNVDLNKLSAVPAGAGSDDEPWIIHLTALRWTDPVTKKGWFISYKVKLATDKVVADMSKYEQEQGRSALDKDISAESYCASRKGSLPTQEELAEALRNGLDAKLDSLRRMSGGLGIKEAEGLWTKTLASDDKPVEGCWSDYLVTYNIKNRHWGCTEPSMMRGIGEFTATTPQAACVVSP